MSLGLTLTIIFGIVFAVALFIGFIYEKEVQEFETILFKYIKLMIKARKKGMSVEEYARKQKMKKTAPQRKISNVIYLDDWVA